jgi:hypothetical protein
MTVLLSGQPGTIQLVRDGLNYISFVGAIQKLHGPLGIDILINANDFDVSAIRS